MAKAESKVAVPAMATREEVVSSLGMTGLAVLRHLLRTQMARAGISRGLPGPLNRWTLARVPEEPSRCTLP